MLMLTRLTGQKIRIGSDIEVKVVEARRGTVRLAVTAPAEVKILRDELLAREGSRASRRLG